MPNLKTNYLGLNLKSPIIVGSSGLTNSVEKIKKLREAGVGAVVLKSLFEEQITQEVGRNMQTAMSSNYPESYYYVEEYTKMSSVKAYLDLIREAKAAVDIPIIASINCYSTREWIYFAKQIEDAGADALELNLYVVNTDKNSNADDYEKIYYDVAEAIGKAISIPFAMKLGLYFSNLVAVVNKLSIVGTKGVVLFNRFYEPDIDIHTLQPTASEIFSMAADIRRSLRWVAIVSDKVKNIDVAASTGIHSGEAVVKQLLAGAKAVQVCSAVYKMGVPVISQMLQEVHNWMNDKEFTTIEEFTGMMSYSKIENPTHYERAQFMKYFSSLE
ncbi:MAG: dihydroorotate dehydrogenase-like protein [Cytophagaceae bacterium]|jgi:dihydroorotate dehydrogenase (fumarate)|nr:dihydroorotate dehydrogenase-like protein [Cytophagaceae bacterium]